MLPEEPPSAPPKNIVASGRTNQSIMVQWQPPPETEHNGVLRGYILRQVARDGPSALPRAQTHTGGGAPRSAGGAGGLGERRGRWACAGRGRTGTQAAWRGRLHVSRRNARARETPEPVAAF